MAANLLEIPDYVKATSPQGLRRFMLQVQTRDSMQYVFHNIQFVDGYWFAWYYKSAKTDTRKAEVIKEIMIGD